MDHQGRLGQVFYHEAVVNAHSVYCEYIHKSSLGLTRAEARARLRGVPTIRKFVHMLLTEPVDYLVG